MKPVPMPLEHGEIRRDASRLLAAYGYYLSILIFCYGALFPFTYDGSHAHVLASWLHASLIPYWDTPAGRMHGITDVAANILLTIPLGFFGFLHRAEKEKAWPLWRWGALGLLLGFAAEMLQLWIPDRSSGTTDIINNGLGTLGGAAIARAFGKQALDFLTGSTAERRNIYLWMLIFSMLAIAGPLDIGPDYFTRFKSGVNALMTGSWQSARSMGQQWVQLSGFVMIGALASRLAVPGRRRRSPASLLCAAALVGLFPVALGGLRLLVESNPLFLSDLAVEFLGSFAGFALGLALPALVCPAVGFCAINLALIAAGLSPFRFVSWPQRSSFQWIPFYEYCLRRTPVSLYELILTLFSFALLGGVMQLSFVRCRRSYVVLYAVFLAGVIESAQRLLPVRIAGITDIFMAALGAWMGSLICAAVESSRAPRAGRHGKEVMSTE